MPKQHSPARELRCRVALVGLAWLICCALPSNLLIGSELRQTPIVQAVQRARPSVVNIRGEKTMVLAASPATPGEVGRRVNGMGTGVVIDGRGYILTNYHVVEGVQRIQVTLADGNMLIARVIKHDPGTDLAIIKVDAADELPVIAIGTSSDLMPGEPVMAVGNAYGYEHTVTRGIISALHRAVQVSDAQFYDDLIQTDASINPGNSGGPLLNIDGEMIGLNVAVRAGAQGIGFAIPADKAMSVAASLLSSHNGRQLWHGVALGSKSVVTEQGLKVVAVETKSPAAEAGLRSGDMITAIDDLEPRRNLDFHRALLQRKAGEKVELSVRRAGDPITVSMKLGVAAKPTVTRPNHPAWQVLGLEFQAIPTAEFRQKYKTRYRGGLTVKTVRPDSPATEQGIRSGDVLVGMHIWETVSLENISYILGRPDFAALSPVKFYILRNKETLYGYLPVTVKTARRK